MVRAVSKSTVTADFAYWTCFMACPTSRREKKSFIYCGCNEVVDLGQSCLSTCPLRGLYTETIYETRFLDDGKVQSYMNCTFAACSSPHTGVSCRDIDFKVETIDQSLHPTKPQTESINGVEVIIIDD